MPDPTPKVSTTAFILISVLIALVVVPILIQALALLVFWALIHPLISIPLICSPFVAWYFSRRDDD